MRTGSNLLALATMALLNLSLAGCSNDEPPPGSPRDGRTPTPAQVTPPDEDAAGDQPAGAGADLGESKPPAAPISADRTGAPAPSDARGLPSINPPRPRVPEPAPPEDPTVASFAGLTGPKPATWMWQPPSRQFSVAEYIVPGLAAPAGGSDPAAPESGGDQARITVFIAGGTMEENVNRWKEQFRDSAGNPVEPILHEMEGNEIPATVVEFAGEYRGMGGVPEPDTLFLTAVVDATGGERKVFIRFVGPRATVEANRDAFMDLVSNLKLVEPEK